MTFKRSLISLLLIACMSLGGFSATIGVKEAGTIAKQVFTEQVSLYYLYSQDQITIQSVDILGSETAPEAYLFNMLPKGWIIISAEDRRWPVVGFSIEENLPIQAIPDPMSEWLSEVGEEINYIRNNNLKSSSGALKEWQRLRSKNTKDISVKSFVAPLLSSRWNQDYPYNAACPEHAVGPGGHCYAGCVATAMSMIMHYHSYPDQGTGSHSYSHPHFGTISANFGAATYDWSVMGNTISPASMDDISTLMFHCGVSVEMNYRPDGSGAMTYHARDAMVQHFGYSVRSEYLQKKHFTNQEWDQLLRESLDMDIPLLYSGSGSGGGHAFLCDGYQDSCYFHFNWGWSGSGNGYFYTSNLSNFNSGQAAIFGLVPYDYPYCKGTKVFTDRLRTFDDGSGYSYYWNNTNCQFLIAPEGITNNINLSFLHFNTEWDHDFLSIYDGNSTNAPLLGRYSGGSLPNPIQSSGSELLLVFESDANFNSHGWTVSYDTLTVGIEEQSEIQNIILWPNPSNGKISLQFFNPDKQNAIIRVFEINGRKVYEHKTTLFAGQESYDLDLTNITPGVYMLKFSAETSCFVQKLVLE